MATNSKSSSILPIAAADLSEKVEEKLFGGSTISKKGAYAAISYMICAVLLVMFNKAALSSYRFPCANVITLCQMALIRTSPLSLTYLLYMLASMESIRGVNVPMYTTLRRTTVVFTMIFEYILVGQRYTHPVLGSVAIILLGTFIAGARDLSFDSYGYLIVFVSNITTAVYLTTIARIGKSSGLNSFGLMWCNGLLCAPILLLWTLSRGDLEVTINFPYLFSPGFLMKYVNKLFKFLNLMAHKAVRTHFTAYGTQSTEEHPSSFDDQVVMLLSCILAFFLNYTIFLNTTLNSALTQTICGNLKDFFTIALGWVIFGGLPFDLFNVIGQLVGFVGSGMYAYYKLFGN